MAAKKKARKTTSKSAPTKRASRKTAAKKTAKKKVAKKKAAEPRVPRTKAQLEKAKEARAAILPDAISTGRRFLTSWTTNAALAEKLQAEHASHPLAPDMDASDWRNLSLRVIRQFERQPGIIECRGRKEPPAAVKAKLAGWSKADSASEWRITKGAKPVMDPLKRQVKPRKPKGEGGKGKGKKAARKKKGGDTTSSKAAPKKRARRVKQAEAPAEEGQPEG